MTHDAGYQAHPTTDPNGTTVIQSEHTSSSVSFWNGPIGTAWGYLFQGAAILLLGGTTLGGGIGAGTGLTADASALTKVKEVLVNGAYWGGKSFDITLGTELGAATGFVLGIGAMWLIRPASVANNASITVVKTALRLVPFTRGIRQRMTNFQQSVKDHVSSLSAVPVTCAILFGIAGAVDGNTNGTIPTKIIRYGVTQGDSLVRHGIERTKSGYQWVLGKIHSAALDMPANIDAKSESASMSGGMMFDFSAVPLPARRRIAFASAPKQFNA